MNKIILGFAAICFGLNGTYADSISVNQQPQIQGMGGAGLALAGGVDSALINPASLADIDGTRGMIPLLIEIPFNVDSVGAILDYNDAIEAPGVSDAEKQAAFETLLGELGNAIVSTRLNFYPSWTGRLLNFGVHIGILGDFLLNSKLRVNGVSSNQVLELNGSALTTGLILGAGYGVLDNSLQFGLTVKPLFRMAFRENDEQTLHDLLLGANPGASIEDQIFGEDKSSSSGFGVGVDVGVKYWLPFLENLRPSVGATLQDIANTRFSGDGLPEDIDQSLSLGLAVHPEIGITRNMFALDFRNILEDQDFGNKLHVGFETLFGNHLAIRAGVSQGYFTGGIAFQSHYFNADAYVSAEEAGDKIHIEAKRTIGFRLSASF